MDLNDRKLATQFLCRHVIGLSSRAVYLDDNGNPTGKEESFCFSGFLLSINNAWAIMTAGHVLEDLKTAQLSRMVAVVDQAIVDYAGIEASHFNPIPFNPLEQGPLYGFNKNLGIDFGIISLNPHYQALLEKNNLLPFTPPQWLYPQEQDFIVHQIVGFPKEFVIAEKNKKGEILATNVSPTFVSVRQNIDDSEAVYRRFCGQILDMEGQNEITGMSGGPILGFYRDMKNELRYSLVAVQSMAVGKKIVYGCFVSDIMRFVKKLCDKYSLSLPAQV